MIDFMAPQIAGLKLFNQKLQIRKIHNFLQKITMSTCLSTLTYFIFGLYTLH